MAVDTSQATVGGSVFSGNSAKSQGGALYQVSQVHGSSVTHACAACTVRRWPGVHACRERATPQPSTPSYCGQHTAWKPGSRTFTQSSLLSFSLGSQRQMLLPVHQWPFTSTHCPQALTCRCPFPGADQLQQATSPHAPS